MPVRCRKRWRSHLPWVLLLLPAVSATATEKSLEPAPESVEELDGAVSRALREEEEREPLLPWLKQRLQDKPPFLRDTRIDARLRSYYFHRRNLDDSRSEAGTIGGAFEYRSGWLRDLFSVGGVFYTSQRMRGPQEREGTLLLEPGQQSISVFGEAWAKLRFREHVATFYRQTFDLPYLNDEDNRMIPNTFEAATATGSFSDILGLDEIQYWAGYVDRMKRRDDSDFVSMSKAAGANGRVSNGLVGGGLLLKPSDRLSFGGVNYFVEDTINIGFVEADYLLLEGGDESLGLRLQGQFTHQQSVGNHDLTESAFDTWMVGARLALSWKTLVLSVAGTSTGNQERIRAPFGRHATYLDLMQVKFNDAGEDSWLVGASYRFKALGLSGLSATVNFAQGQDGRDADGKSRPDRWEIDAIVDYRFEKGPVRGLWLRLMGSVLDLDGEPRASKELRVILNYELPVL